MKQHSVEDLLGKTLTNIEYRKRKKKYESSDELIFFTSEGERFRMYHSPDCCEWVRIEDICGYLSDLVGSPLLMAEEVSNHDRTGGYNYNESHTWTFYKFATQKGYVTIRWLGESNGYYSESVDFEKL